MSLTAVFKVAISAITDDVCFSSTTHSDTTDDTCEERSRQHLHSLLNTALLFNPSTTRKTNFLSVEAIPTTHLKQMQPLHSSHKNQPPRADGESVSEAEHSEQARVTGAMTGFEQVQNRKETDSPETKEAADGAK
ncbi:MAG: hypothetical protein GY821_17145 [Gammaproteobacteria bacterium]|nr:hypothetical protein [Gammaproteobacteria bacterium]